MLRTLQTAPSFGGSYEQAGATHHPLHTATRWLRQAATALRTINEAWRECVAAHHQYWRLMSRGVPHEIAIREALGFGPAPAQKTCKSTCKSTEPLGFAGKA
jgi:hypothetical protein